MDMQGRQWLFAQDLDPAWRGIVVSIVTLPSGNKEPEISGSGFIVLADVGQALCITAAHVIKDCARVLGIKETRSRASTLWFPPAEHAAALREASARGELRVHVVINGRDDFALITQAVWASPLDACLLVIKSDLFTPDLRPFAMNSDRFESGTPVIAFGLPTSAMPLHREEPGRKVYRYESRLEARRGQIRAVHPRDTHATCPSYELTLPIPHGMSGGPIVLAPEVGADPQVIAFASHDYSTKESCNDCNVPGSGIALPILWTYLLPPPPGNAIGGPFLLDLVRNGWIRDLGQGWENLEIVSEEGRNVFKRRAAAPPA